MAGPGNGNSGGRCGRPNNSSCPALCRASTSSSSAARKDVDGRVKPGHDDEEAWGDVMSGRLLMHLVLALVVAFLIGPFVIIVATSFSAGDTLAFPPQGFSLKWIFKVFTVRSFRESFVTSMILAIGGTLVALALGI